MKKVIIALIVISVMGAGYYFFFSKKSAPEPEKTTEEQKEIKSEVEANQEETQNTEPRVIEITAKRFQFEPEVINVKKGEKVKFIVEDKDLPHGIMIPDIIFPPEQKNFKEFEVTFDKTGEFGYYCANEECGGGHAKMRGKIIVS